MSEHEPCPPAPAWPGHTDRPAATAMKAVLVVAAVVASIVLLYMVFFIGIFVMAG